MDSIDQLLQLRQGGLSIEEYVHQFCELTYQVPLYDEILFKDLFHFGLNRYIKSLFPGGEFKCCLRGFIDCALLCAGSSLTVGVSDEERNTAPETKMADAPEGRVKRADSKRSECVGSPGRIKGKRSECQPGQNKTSQRV